MDSSRVSGRRNIRNGSAASSNRNRSDRRDRARQGATDDAARQKRRTAGKREAVRRQTQSAFRDSIEQDRAIQKQYAQAGVEKMLRSVVRKESRRSQQTAQQKDTAAQSQYVRDKLNSTYNQTASELIQDENLEPSPSQRQQQRAIDDYQQSTRNNIDRTLELVI